LSERWFFALWPDPGVQAALAAQARDLVPAGARAIHPDELHLTLAFLGPLAPEVLRCVEKAAERVESAPFELLIGRIGLFDRARVLWCAPDFPPQPLIGLVSGLRGQLEVCDLTLDPRPYRPHVTLARRVAAAASVKWPTAVRWPVREFVLAAGYGGAGPRYRIRRRWPLALDRSETGRDPV
jgi:2'-5' RNA ligase